MQAPSWRKVESGDDFAGVMPFDTDLVFAISRTQLRGADDIAALVKVMDCDNTQPLSA